MGRETVIGMSAPGRSWQKPYPTQERERSDRSRLSMKSEIDKYQRPAVISGRLPDTSGPLAPAWGGRNGKSQPRALT